MYARFEIIRLVSECNNVSRNCATSYIRVLVSLHSREKECLLIWFSSNAKNIDISQN